MDADLITQVANGQVAADLLVTPLFDELRLLARRQLRGPGATLEPTDLVQEAYLRLRSRRELNADERTAFLFAAAIAMRRVLVDRARARRASKRGGNWSRVELSDTLAGPDGLAPDLLDLNEALEELEGFDPLRARIAELVLFSGLEYQEVAQALRLDGHDMDARAAGRAWRAARAWLAHRLGRSTP